MCKDFLPYKCYQGKPVCIPKALASSSPFINKRSFLKVGGSYSLLPSTHRVNTHASTVPSTMSAYAFLLLNESRRRNAPFHKAYLCACSSTWPPKPVHLELVSSLTLLNSRSPCSLSEDLNYLPAPVHFIIGSTLSSSLNQLSSASLSSIPESPTFGSTGGWTHHLLNAHVLPGHSRALTSC